MPRTPAFFLLSALATLQIGCGGLAETTEVTSRDVESLSGQGSSADVRVEDASERPRERLVWGDTEHLQQIAPSGDPALGIRGLDLGVSCMLGGELTFVFGDAVADGELLDRDPAARAAPGSGLEDLRLEWERTPDGRFAPLGFTEEIAVGAYEVPVECLENAGQTHVFYASDFDLETEVHGASVLAHVGEDGDFGRMQVDHVVPSTRFINVNVVDDDGTLWIFGSGAYRASSVYLARVPSNQLADRDAWEYLSDSDADGPSFSLVEDDALPLISSECVGELSVRREPERGLYLMTYNCAHPDEPRGVHLRTSETPFGPWSEPIVIFDPVRDGYGQFIHRAVCSETPVYGCAEADDGLGNPGREGEWGGEYGPYLIEPWLESEGGLLTLYYTLSSWNPYAVHLIRTTLLIVN
jgi:hypothetical protein